LTKVHVYSSIIDENSLHLEVGCLAGALVFELDESILQAVARLLVAYDFARENRTETTEDEFEVGVGSDRVEFANKQDVLGWFDLGEGEITHHLEGQGLCTGFPLAANLFCGFFIDLLVQVDIVGYPHGSKLSFGRLWRLTGFVQAGRIGERVIKDHGVLNADVNQRISILVGDGTVDGLDGIETLDDFAKNGSLTIEIVCIVAQGDEKLACSETDIGVGRVWRSGHGHGASFDMLQLGVEGCGKVLLGGAIEKAPDRRAAIGRGRVGTERIAGLEREILLNRVDGGEVVILELAEFEETIYIHQVQQHYVRR
jgi:hypothetical protein